VRLRPFFGNNVEPQRSGEAPSKALHPTAKSGARLNTGSRVAPTSRLAGPLRSQDRPGVGPGDPSADGFRVFVGRPDASGRYTLFPQPVRRGHRPA
jgi:hypothetical protein